MLQQNHKICVGINKNNYLNTPPAVREVSVKKEIPTTTKTIKGYIIFNTIIIIVVNIMIQSQTNQIANKKTE